MRKWVQFGTVRIIVEAHGIGAGRDQLIESRTVFIGPGNIHRAHIVHELIELA